MELFPQELSWLAFNERVLQEAADKNVRVAVNNDILLLSLTPQGRDNPMLLAELQAEVKQQLKLGVNLRIQ